MHIWNAIIVLPVSFVDIRTLTSSIVITWITIYRTHWVVVVILLMLLVAGVLIWTAHLLALWWRHATVSISEIGPLVRVLRMVR